MMLKKTLTALLFCAGMTCPLSGQNTAPATLTLAQYLQSVRENHPEARQAANLPGMAAAELLAARGGFDPKLYGAYENKTFDGKNYFSTGDYGVKLPTRFGTEVKVAYTTASGIFLNDADRLPADGQAVIGLSQPLWQGLLFDERRADLRRARQSQTLYEAERRQRLNDLFFEATEVYWKWAFADGQRRILREALQTAQMRFLAIKSTWELGDRMAMDTLESFIQVQDRQLLLNEAELEWQAASAKLNNFVWAGDTAAPDMFPDDFAAESPALVSAGFENLASADRAALENKLLEKHPALLAADAKIAQLQTERRLKLEKRKPKLNVEYNFLGDGARFPALLADNYKWGVRFSSPLLFRSERGDLQLADLKIENTRLTRDQKARDLQNKLRLAWAEWDNALAQLELYGRTLENYRQLLQLETTRFELGESTFFLINSREIKLIEAQVKQVKAQTALRVAGARVIWAAGGEAFQN